MVAAFVRSHGTEFVKAAGTTDTYALTATVPAGNLLVMALVHDNSATTLKPFVSSITKMSGESASWVHLGRSLSASTSTGAFADGELWCIKTTVDWTTGTSLTVTYDTTITMKSQNILEFSGVEATTRSTTGVATYSTTTTAASAATTGTAPVIGDLAIGLIFGSNVAAAQAGDTDTTGGSWSSVVGVGSTGGSGATNNFGITQHKIVTSTSHQTFNNSAAMTAGNGSIVAVLQATVDPLVTQAAYRVYGDGTETGSTALAAQDTAPTVVVSSDANVQVRVRLQETAGGVSTAATDWQLQWEKNTSGTWTSVVASGLISYEVANSSSGGSDGTAGAGYFQSFEGNGLALTSVEFSLYRNVTVTGNIEARLYAHTGTFGTSSVGTGSPLATSTARAKSSLSSTSGYVWETFAFDGTYTLVAGTKYVIGFVNAAGSTGVIEHDGDGAGTAPGNGSFFNGSTWSSSAADRLHKIHTTDPTTVLPYDSASLTDAAATTNRLGAPSDTLADGYAQTNADGTTDYGTSLSYGQSFTGNGGKLASAGFYLSKSGTPASTTVVAELYAHSGTFGTDSIGTGTPLATSTTTVPVSSVGTTVAWFDFAFDRTFTLVNGTNYVILATVNVSGASGNTLKISVDGSTPTHPGNRVQRNSAGTFFAGSATDSVFRVYTGGSFVAGKLSEDGLVDNAGWTALDYTELLYSVTLKSADLADADSLRFRVLRNAATTGMTYTAYPTITVSKVTTPQGTGTGSWSFTGTGVGYRLPKATPTGSWSFTGAVVGKRSPVAVPVGAWSFAGTAVGTVPAAPPEEGAATGTWVWVGAGVGKRTPKATPTGAWSFAGAVVGKRTPVATVTGAWSFTGAAVGKRVAGATGTGAWSYAGTAVGAAPAVGAKTGTATGTWTFTGAAVGKRVAAATPTGTLAWVGAAVGKRTPVAAPTGSWSFTGAGVGKRTPKATPTGAWSFTGTAAGVAPAVGMKYGTATGAWSFAGAAAGTTTRRGTATGAWNLTGAAVGKRVAGAAPTGTFAFTGAAVGKRTPKAAPTGTWNLAGTAVGYRSPKATVASTLAWTGTAYGSAPTVGLNEGFAFGSTNWAGAGTGTTVRRGTATGTWNYTGYAFGVTTRRGTATTGAWSYTGTTTAATIRRGAGSGAWSFTGAGVGKRTPKATSSGAWSFTGAAFGQRPRRGTSTGTWTFTGAAAALTTHRATGSGAWSFAGAAVGKRTAKATPAGTWTWVGTAVGKRSPKAAPAGAWVFTGYAFGGKPLRGTAAGSWQFTGTALARTQHRGLAVGLLAYTGAPVVGVAPALDFADGKATGFRHYVGFAVGLTGIPVTPASRIMVVAAETRLVVVAYEQRLLVVAADPRLVTVAAEDRTVEVPAETRTALLEGASA